MNYLAFINVILIALSFISIYEGPIILGSAKNAPYLIKQSRVLFKSSALQIAVQVMSGIYSIYVNLTKKIHPSMIIVYTIIFGISIIWKIILQIVWLRKENSESGLRTELIFAFLTSWKNNWKNLKRNFSNITNITNITNI